MFLKKEILNMLSIVLLTTVFVFPQLVVDYKFFIILLVISIVVPKGKEKLTEVVLRYLSSTFLVIYLISDVKPESSIDLVQFIVTMLLIFILTTDTRKKLLTIVLACFPVLTVEVSDISMILLSSSFLLLPLLHEKLKQRDFSLYCLACIVVIGNFGLEQVYISLIAFIILSLFICTNDLGKQQKRVA